MKTRACLLLVLTLVLPAQAQDFHEGTDFVRIAQPPGPRDLSRVQVEEFFWYGCPHCYALEPELEKWVARKPADVDFVRVPNSLGREVGLIHSKAYYTQQLLGVEDKVHRALFDAIHQQHQALGTVPEVVAFIASRTQRPAAEIEGAINGFMVDNQMRRAEDLARQYSISGTPAVVVGGRYGVKAGDSAKMLATVDYLVERVRDEQQEIAAGTALGQSPAPVAVAPAPVVPATEAAADADPVAAAAQTAPAPEKPRPLGLIVVIGIALLAGGAAWWMRRRP